MAKVLALTEDEKMTEGAKEGSIVLNHMMKH